MQIVIKYFAIISCFLLASCGVVPQYIAQYSVGLTTVESPADAKQQFGDTKVIVFEDNGINKFRYEDDYINIVWYVGKTDFSFSLYNKSNHTIKINWDDISYVDTKGSVSRVIHAGVKYVDKNNSQPTTTIPKKASLSDILAPTDNIHLDPNPYIGWVKDYLIPCVYTTEEALKANAENYVGKTMIITMPIVIENVQNEYTFTFTVNDLITKTK